jgi:hypothetical protein
MFNQVDSASSYDASKYDATTGKVGPWRQIPSSVKAALQKYSMESNANIRLLDDSSPQRFFTTLRAHIPLVHNLLVHMRFLPSVGSTVVNWARYDDR